MPHAASSDVAPVRPAETFPDAAKSTLNWKEFDA
jgi:hypothetical protein